MDLVSFIKDVGFPIAVAAFVLIRLNGKVGKLTDAMVTLTNTMQRYVEHSENETAKTQSHDDARTIAAVQQVLDAVRDRKA